MPEPAAPRLEPAGWWDALLDLALGAACTVCARPGRVLCAACLRGLPTSAGPARPTPCPDGLPPTWATTAYDGAVRDLVLGHKERGRLALARPLGALLATAALAAVRGAARGAEPGDAPVVPVLLVPVPSRPGVDRGRGHAPTAALVRAAAASLRAGGVPRRSRRCWPRTAVSPTRPASTPRRARPTWRARCTAPRRACAARPAARPGRGWCCATTCSPPAPRWPRPPAPCAPAACRSRPRPSSPPPGGASRRRLPPATPPRGGHPRGGRGADDPVPSLPTGR